MRNALRATIERKLRCRLQTRKTSKSAKLSVSSARFVCAAMKHTSEPCAISPSTRETCDNRLERETSVGLQNRQNEAKISPKPMHRSRTKLSIRLELTTMRREAGSRRRTATATTKTNSDAQLTNALTNAESRRFTFSLTDDVSTQCRGASESKTVKGSTWCAAETSTG